MKSETAPYITYEKIIHDGSLLTDLRITDLATDAHHPSVYWNISCASNCVISRNRSGFEDTRHHLSVTIIQIHNNSPCTCIFIYTITMARAFRFCIYHLPPTYCVIFSGSFSQQWILNGYRLLMVAYLNRIDN